MSITDVGLFVYQFLVALGGIPLDRILGDTRGGLDANDSLKDLGTVCLLWMCDSRVMKMLHSLLVTSEMIRFQSHQIHY